VVVLVAQRPGWVYSFSDEEVAARPGAHMIDFVDYRGDLARVARLTRH
jgi:hypothetical protein